MQENNPTLDKLNKILDDIQAIDIITIDVRAHTTITDYMVICSGRSSRHVKSIAEYAMEHMKAAGIPALNYTGLESGDWALVDFGDAVLHVMQPDTRALYSLESLWQDRTEQD
jgi:ribosome-associated protein